MAVKSKRKVKPNPPAETQAGFSVYIGPNIVGVIQTNTIYPVCREDALELPQVRMAREKVPGITELIVDGNTLPTDIVKVKKQGDPLYKSYRALLK